LRTEHFASDVVLQVDWPWWGWNKTTSLIFAATRWFSIQIFSWYCFTNISFSWWNCKKFQKLEERSTPFATFNSLQL